MIKIIKEHKAFLLYAIFGVLTTIINTAVYQLFYAVLNFTNVSSNIIAWILAVSFAYITNRKFVFESKNNEKKALIAELTSFFACRLATGVLDIAIMFVAVDLLSLNSLAMKLISNVVVILINYIASKLIIFKKRKV